MVVGTRACGVALVLAACGNGELLDVELDLAPDGERAAAFDHASGQRVTLDLETRATTPALGDRHWWRPRCTGR